MLAVGEVLVDLIREHPHVVLRRPLADRNRLFRRVDGTARVVWRDEQQHFRLWRARLLQLLDRDLELGLLGRVDDDGDATGERNRLGVGRPIRSRHDDLVARIAQRSKRNEHRVLATVGDENLRCVAHEVAVALGLHRDRLAELGQASGRCVTVILRIAGGLDRSFDDVVRSRKVRLPCTETDHVFALGLERLRLGIDGQGRRFRDGCEACRNTMTGVWMRSHGCHAYTVHSLGANENGARQ